MSSVRDVMTCFFDSDLRAYREKEKFLERSDVQKVALSQIGSQWKVTVEFKARIVTEEDMVIAEAIELLSTPIRDIPGLVKRFDSH